MLGEFLDKASSFLDRRFLLAYWFPSLISLSAGLLIYSWPKAWEPLNQYFSALQSGNFSFQLMIILGSLLSTLVLAYLLQAFSHSFVQFWEGYWPKPLWAWYKDDVKRVDAKWEKLKEERAHAFANKLDSCTFLQEKLFYEYPPKKSDCFLPD